MQLPNREKAYVDEAKLRDYLLSETHPVGQAKAKFFRLVGFNATNVDALEESLLDLARTAEVKESKPSPYGVKYVIEGALHTPTGRVVRMRTVWIIEAGRSIRAL